MGTFLHCLWAEPWVNSHGSACMPVNNCFFAVVLWFCGHKPHWFSELSDLDACPLGGSLKNGVLNVEPNPPLLRKELGVNSWLYGAGPGVGFMARVCLSLSYVFPYGYFLICLMCRSLSASFWISFRGNHSVCSCTFGVSVGGGEFTYVTILVDPYFKLFYPFGKLRPLSVCRDILHS